MLCQGFMFGFFVFLKNEKKNHPPASEAGLAFIAGVFAIFYKTEETISQNTNLKPGG